MVLVSSRRGASLPAEWDLAVRPEVAHCDVGDAAQVEALVGRYPLLRGVVHSAGVLADRTLPQLEAADFERVYRPKVLGARHLHRSTLGRELDFFVLFSSIAAGMGGAGQGNYAAANGCLDALAEERRAVGLPAVSIRWGAWVGGGMAGEATFRSLSRMSRVCHFVFALWFPLFFTVFLSEI